jgi:hypothetical protein
MSKPCITEDQLQLLRSWVEFLRKHSLVTQHATADAIEAAIAEIRRLSPAGE